MGTRATVRLEVIWGQRVKARRELLEYSQHQLGVRVDCTAQTIYKIEKGLMTPRDHLKIAIARELRTTPDKLFPWEHQLTDGEAAA